MYNVLVWLCAALSIIKINFTQYTQSAIFLKVINYTQLTSGA